MTKTALGLAALLAAAAGAGLYAWKGVYEPDRTEAVKKDRDEHLLAPPPALIGAADAGARSAEVLGLIIISGGDRTVLERAPGGEWTITSPVTAKADRLIVDAITSQLKQARFKSTIDEHPDPSALEKFGLVHPVFLVEARVQVDGEPKTLRLEGGIENSFDGTIFMRRNGEQPVYAAEGSVRYTMAKSTLELRDRQVLAVEEPQLTSISVKSKANDWKLERLDGLWSLVRPTREFADPTQVSAMVGSLSSAKAQEFPTNSEALRALFEKPALDATLTFKAGASTRLRFVRPAGDAADPILVLREDSDGSSTIAGLEASALQLDRNPFELKDRSLVRFKRDQVTGIVLQSPAGTVVLAKESRDASVETWRVLAPRSGKAKTFKVTSLLWALSTFKALAWGEEKPKDWAKFGLDPKARSVTVLGQGESELAKLTIGTDVPGKSNTVYVRGTRPQLAESDSSRFNEFPWSVADLLDEPDAGAP